MRNETFPKEESLDSVWQSSKLWSEIVQLADAILCASDNQAILSLTEGRIASSRSEFFGRQQNRPDVIGN